jgi:hypothetical protein
MKNMIWVVTLCSLRQLNILEGHHLHIWGQRASKARSKQPPELSLPPASPGFLLDLLFDLEVIFVPEAHIFSR